MSSKLSGISRRGALFKEVAAALFRWIKTIENHIASIHCGLGVQSRAELVRDTVERGLTSVDLSTWLKITGVSGGVGTSASLNQPNILLEQAGR